MTSTTTQVITAYGSSKYETSVNRTFAVPGTPNLTIHDTAGSIHVVPGANGQVTMRITKKVEGVAGAAAAQGELSTIVVDVGQSGNAITVDAHFTNEVSSGSRTVDLVITTPASTSASVDAEAGNIEARGISGLLKIRATAGNVDASGVSFASGSQIRGGAGNVTLDGIFASGASLDVHLNTGSVTLRLPASTSARLNASTGTGTILISGWSITPSRDNLTGASVSGDLSANPRGTITVRVDTGTITLSAT